MFGDFWIDEFAAVCSKPSERAGLVLAHEAAVAGDIGGEDGREPAIDPLSAQDCPPDYGGSLIAQRALLTISRPTSTLIDLVQLDHVSVWIAQEQLFGLRTSHARE